MFIKGYPDYDREGQEVKTGIVVGKATRDGELKETRGGKPYAVASVRAYTRKDGTAAFLTVKAFGDDARKIAATRKGDTVCAAGRISEREYNEKVYVDFLVDFVFSNTQPEAVQMTLQAQQSNFNDLAAAVEKFQEIDPEEQGELPF